MEDLLKLIYDPPPIPALDLPVILKVAKIPLDKALELFYARGWYDGFIAGVVLTMLVMSRKGK